MKLLASVALLLNLAIRREWMAGSVIPGSLTLPVPGENSHHTDSSNMEKFATRMVKHGRINGYAHLKLQ